MNLYQQQHQFYCGIDLHANKMYACVVDQAGKKRRHQNFHSRDTDSFLEKPRPFQRPHRRVSIGLALVCACRIRKFIAVRIDFN